MYTILKLHVTLQYEEGLAQIAKYASTSLHVSGSDSCCALPDDMKDVLLKFDTVPK